MINQERSFNRMRLSYAWLSGTQSALCISQLCLLFYSETPTPLRIIALVLTVASGGFAWRNMMMSAWYKRELQRMVDARLELQRRVEQAERLLRFMNGNFANAEERKTQ